MFWNNKFRTVHFLELHNCYLYKFGRVMRTVNCLNSWNLRSFILFQDYGAKLDYSSKVLVVLMFRERQNVRLELVKILGSENKQNVTTIRLSFYPGGL